MAAFDSACTWLCATYQRRDGAALSLDPAFIRVTGSAIGFPNSLVSSQRRTGDELRPKCWKVIRVHRCSCQDVPWGEETKPKKLLNVRCLTKYRGNQLCPRPRGTLHRAGRQYSFACFGRKGCAAREPESCFDHEYRQSRTCLGRAPSQFRTLRTISVADLQHALGMICSTTRFAG
jgi:hypothetical protein